MIMTDSISSRTCAALVLLVSGAAAQSLYIAPAPPETPSIFAAPNVDAGGGSIGLAPVLADVTGDGLADVISVPPLWPTVVIHDSLGDCRLGPARAVGVNFPIGAATPFDIDGDGDLDLVVAGIDSFQFQPAAVLYNDGTGNFGPPVRLPINASQAVALPGDVDGDGVAEIVVIGWMQGLPTLEIIEQFGGTFVPVPGSAHAYNGGGSVTLLGDFNGDGLLDLYTYGSIIGRPVPEFHVYPGQGTSFGPPIVTLNPQYCGVPLFRDGDGDGILDIYCLSNIGPSYLNASVSGLAVWKGLPNGTFLAPRPLSPYLVGQASPWSRDMQDFNLDGIPDFIVFMAIQDLFNPLPPTNVHYPTDFRVELFLGDGQGDFRPAQVIYVARQVVRGWLFATGWGDGDGDGDPDIFIIPDGVPPLTTPNAGVERVVIPNRIVEGRGCGGASGVPFIGATRPEPGSTFTVSLYHPVSLAPALLGASFGLIRGIPCFDPLVDIFSANRILPVGSFGSTATDAAGTASFTFPLPPDPALLGASVFAQWGVADPTAPYGIAVTPVRTLFVW